ncbi:hypothetical protein ABKA04_002529 [Annulohypoxylon sp. FPYF3050]
MAAARDDKYWWDHPLIVCFTRGLDERTTRQHLSRIADYPIHQNDDYNHEFDHLEVISVDFEDQKEFLWEVSVPEDGRSRVILVKNAPNDWDIAEFSNYLLSEWIDWDVGNGTRYLVLLPPPKQAFMTIEQFWKDQVSPHDHPANDWPPFMILTANGWIKMFAQEVASWVNSIDVDKLDAELIDDGEAVREYRNEPAAPFTTMLTTQINALSIS